MLVVLVSLAILLLGPLPALVSPVGATAPDSHSPQCSYDSFGDVALAQPNRNVDPIPGLVCTEAATSLGDAEFPSSTASVYDSSASFVAPSGLVNETAGGLTNLGRGSARGHAFFDDFNPGQGFSGVYDEATGSILAFPSGPGGVVPRRGGHAVVNQRLTEAVGAPGGQRAGFTAILQTDGSLQVQWLSRSVNPSGYVPDSLRPAIIDALSQTSGRTVVA